MKRILFFLGLVSVGGVAHAITFKGSSVLPAIEGVVAPTINDKSQYDNQVGAGTIVYDASENLFYGRTTAASGAGAWSPMGISSDFYSEGNGTLGTLTWDGSAPGGTVTKIYWWVKTGKRVDVWFRIKASSAGSGNNIVTFLLPTDIPQPAEPANAGGNEGWYFGSGMITDGVNNSPPAAATTGSEIYMSLGDLTVAVHARTAGGIGAVLSLAHISYMTE